MCTKYYAKWPNSVALIKIKIIWSYKKRKNRAAVERFLENNDKVYQESERKKFKVFLITNALDNASNVKAVLYTCVKKLALAQHISIPRSYILLEKYIYIVYLMSTIVNTRFTLIQVFWEDKHRVGSYTFYWK